MDTSTFHRLFWALEKLSSCQLLLQDEAREQLQPNDDT